MVSVAKSFDAPIKVSILTHLYTLSWLMMFIDPDWTVLLFFIASVPNIRCCTFRCLGLETLWYQVPSPKYKHYPLNVYWYCNHVFIRYFETLCFTLVFVWSLVTYLLCCPRKSFVQNIVPSPTLLLHLWLISFIYVRCQVKTHIWCSLHKLLIKTLTL